MMSQGPKPLHYFVLQKYFVVFLEERLYVLSLGQH